MSNNKQKFDNSWIDCRTCIGRGSILSTIDIKCNNCYGLNCHKCNSGFVRENKYVMCTACKGRGKIKAFYYTSDGYIMPTNFHDSYGYSRL